MAAWFDWKAAYCVQQAIISLCEAGLTEADPLNLPKILNTHNSHCLLLCVGPDCVSAGRPRLCSNETPPTVISAFSTLLLSFSPLCFACCLRLSLSPTCFCQVVNNIRLSCTLLPNLPQIVSYTVCVTRFFRQELEYNWLHIVVYVSAMNAMCSCLYPKGNVVLSSSALGF